MPEANTRRVWIIIDHGDYLTDEWTWVRDWRQAQEFDSLESAQAALGLSGRVQAEIKKGTRPLRQ